MSHGKLALLVVVGILALGVGGGFALRAIHEEPAPEPTQHPADKANEDRRRALDTICEGLNDESKVDEWLAAHPEDADKVPAVRRMNAQLLLAERGLRLPYGIVIKEVQATDDACVGGKWTG